MKNEEKTYFPMQRMTFFTTKIHQYGAIIKQGRTNKS